ncbi:zf-HC2 domain-containing protein [Gemmatimonadota bacterium]
MKHVEIYMDEYLRGELPRYEAERVAAHLSGCDRCRSHAEWLKGFDTLAESARIEPPAEVLIELGTRLAAIPAQIDREEIDGRSEREKTVPFTRTPAWLAWSTPLLKTAAVLLLGMLVGYGLRGAPTQRTIADLPPAFAETERMVAPAPAGSGPDVTWASLRGTSAEELEERVTELERTLLATYLARVEATVTYFVNGTSEGVVATLPAEATRNLLAATANLKTDSKTAGDTRMVNLFGQIESILTEIEKISTERDLGSARFIAGIIEEQGLLSTLQRIKVGLEE